jgi:hypothetical protein
VISEPPGAYVAIDGKFIGNAPVTLTPLPPGTHPIVVSNSEGSIERTIDLAAGENASVVFSMAKASATGWLQLSSPFDVQLIERDEVIGTSGTKIMMSAGRHDLLIVNRALGYQELRSVTVARGQTANVRIDAPQVAVSINARPWADVSIDGVSLGQTPLANAAVAVGVRRIVFRHPDLGERQETAIITTKSGQRIAVDLTK